MLRAAGRRPSGHPRKVLRRARIRAQQRTAAAHRKPPSPTSQRQRRHGASGDPAPASTSGTAAFPPARRPTVIGAGVLVVWSAASACGRRWRRSTAPWSPRARSSPPARTSTCSTWRAASSATCWCARAIWSRPTSRCCGWTIRRRSAKLRRLVLREYRLLIMQARLEAEIVGQGLLSLCLQAWQRTRRPGGAGDLRAPADRAAGAPARQADEEQVSARRSPA